MMDRERLEALQESVETSRRSLRPFREIRYQLINEVAGSIYGEKIESYESNPMNLLDMAIFIYSQFLCSGTPKSDVKTEFESRQAEADTIKYTLDKIARRMNLKDKGYKYVLDAMYGLGMMKLGIHTTWRTYPDGEEVSQGQLFAELVDLDNWVHDFNARTWEECDFMGDRYRVSLDDLRNDDTFDQTVVEMLESTEPQDNNEDGNERVQSIGGHLSNNGSEYDEKIELWDIFLQRERRFITVPAEENGRIMTDVRGGNAILRDVEWNGYAKGPYFPLGLSLIPGNLMPVPPAAKWSDMHDMVNTLYNKLRKQAQRQKSILVAPHGGDDDAAKLLRTYDGQAITLSTTQLPQEVNYGGINQQSLAFAIHAFNQFKWISGNIDTLGGLGPSAGTVGQESIINQNSSRLINFMVDRVNEAFGEIFRAIGYYTLHDVSETHYVNKPIPGTDGLIPGQENVSIPITFNAGNMEGDWEDYEITVDAYSMQEMNPRERADMLLQIFGTYILPALPIIQQQGGRVNIDVLFNSLARGYGLDELKRMIVFDGSNLWQQKANQGTGPAQAAAPVKPPTQQQRATGTEKTPRGQDDELVRRMMGSIMSGEGAQ